MIELRLIIKEHVDAAWKDGASTLSEACLDECTIDQLKMLCARGERQLVRMDEDGKAIGWGVFIIDQLPNMRILHITQLVAHNAGFERFLGQIKDIAKAYGCSQVRCSAKPVQARLYALKCGMEQVYTTLKAEV